MACCRCHTEHTHTSATVVHGGCSAHLHPTTNLLRPTPTAARPLGSRACWIFYDGGHDERSCTHFGDRISDIRVFDASCVLPNIEATDTVHESTMHPQKITSRTPLGNTWWNLITDRRMQNLRLGRKARACQSCQPSRMIHHQRGGLIDGLLKG
jgi:hypothetical protein